MPRHQPNNRPLPEQHTLVTKHHSTRPSHTPHKPAPKKPTTRHCHNTNNQLIHHKLNYHKKGDKPNMHITLTHSRDNINS